MQTAEHVQALRAQVLSELDDVRDALFQFAVTVEKTEDKGELYRAQLFLKKKSDSAAVAFNQFCEVITCKGSA